MSITFKAYAVNNLCYKAAQKMPKVFAEKCILLCSIFLVERQAQSKRRL